ncbi:uncharacterized protein PHACADRAFT_262641 [Phanerochaete carnosa HHB-10118-sp]|uniref:Uncharacterized protein n=1 Tax=Phanerochaete carnosa (strain HHB-10118-sp) TaxID=650164 RepID=K5UQM2_PHACS|nr:uncharacterized protein PHACADRAFT_262641 [Phanerochaete carnosa HHB-10118-sp]EKM52131.1 hypothetical protein PHACADRAFT_262641 [Phanerochaete carnosa HHB-10118-sp]
MADVLCKTMVQEVDRYFHQSGSNYSTYRADFASSVAPAVPLFRKCTLQLLGPC